MGTQNTCPSAGNETVLAELPFNLDESSVSEWLGNLPISDKIETCKTVFSALRHLNQRDVAHKARFAILERFRTLVFCESSNLANRFTGATFPLEQNSRKIAKLSAKFHSELASGYQLIANHGEFDEAYSKHEQACVLHRIARSLGVSLLRIAQMYEAPSPRIWHVLKTLYKNAESKQLLDIGIPDPAVPFPATSTIAGILGTTVLFAISNPYRYAQTEMDRLFRLFDAHSEKIKWLNGLADPRQFRFGIDLENPSAPQYISSSRNFQNRSFRSIDPSNMLAAISNLYADQSHQSSLPKAATISVVFHQFGNPRKVHIKRLGTDTELTLGLENIADLFRRRLSNQTTTANAGPLVDWLAGSDFEILPLNNDVPVKNPSTHRAPTAPVGHDSRITQPFLYSDYRLANSARSSVGSSTVHCEAHQSELPGHLLAELKSDNLTIGQVIALKDKISPIKIGVIRWMQARADNQFFYYGIEHLSSNCHLASAFVSARKYTDILLLEKNTRISSSFSVIMPPVICRSGSRMTVKRLTATDNFMIERLLESSPFFCHYSLKQLTPASTIVD